MKGKVMDMGTERHDASSRPRDHILTTFSSRMFRHRSDHLRCNMGGSRVRAGALSCCKDPPLGRDTPVGEGSLQMHTPLGPDGLWKTGQRVPVSGIWIDQYGAISHHSASSTFPPCIDRKGECAYRELIQEDVRLVA